MSGVIGKRQLNVGETALPSQAVMSILNIGTVKVKVSIPETELKYIGTNTPSAIMVEAANSTFNGGTIEKGIQADVATHTYDIRINVSNPGHKLLPGMVASVSFPTIQSAASASIFVPMIIAQSSFWMPVGVTIFAGGIGSLIMVVTMLPVIYWKTNLK